jgi:hypothetical protein
LIADVVTDGWMFRNLSRRLEETPSIWFTSLAKKNDRKQVAQKFYSLLVLQKVNNNNPGLHIQILSFFRLTGTVSRDGFGF